MMMMIDLTGTQNDDDDDDDDDDAVIDLTGTQ